MISMLSFMGLILIGWAILLLILIGWGLFVHRIFGFRTQSPDRALSSFWLGFSFVLIFLQVWHLFLPVNRTALALVFLIGFLALLWSRRTVSEQWKKIRSLNRIWLFLIFLFVLFLANRAMGPIRIYDAGLYHLPTIRWLSEYPIVPGLGNLHHRLAWNSSYYLFFALLEENPIGVRSFHLVNGLPALVLWLQIGMSFRKIFQGEALPFHDILRMLFAIPLAGQCLIHASDTSNDFAIFVVGMIVSVELCKALFHEVSHSEIRYAVFLIVTLSAIGISIKLSFLAMGLLVSVAGIIRIIQVPKDDKDFPSRQSAWLALPGISILILWMVRGVLLSGYPLFPNPVISCAVDWKIPENSAQRELEIIKNWARSPYVDPNIAPQGWSWFMPWLERIFSSRRELFEFVLPLLLALAGFLIFLFRLQRSSFNLPYFLLFLSPAVGSILYWFFLAPGLRFAGVAFWYLAFGIIGFLFQSSRPSLRWLVPVALILLAGVARIYYAPLIVRPGSDRGEYPLPSVALKSFITESGFTVYVPEEGVQCWESSLLCTPYPNSGLRLRKEGNLQKGFNMSADQP